MKVCGCMSTRHDLFGSCKSCGRIVCVKEKTEVCPFCQATVYPPMPAEECRAQGYDESTIKAYQLKDTLLQYQRENAKRTQVHDAQADYYETSTWLSDEEKAELDIKEAERRALVDSINKPSQSYSLTLNDGDIAMERVKINDDGIVKTSEIRINNQRISQKKNVNATADSKTFQFQSMYKMENTTISCTVNGTISAVDNEETDICGEDYSDPVNLENVGLLHNPNKVGDIYRAVAAVRPSTVGEHKKLSSKQARKFKSVIQHFDDDI